MIYMILKRNNGNSKLKNHEAKKDNNYHIV